MYITPLILSSGSMHFIWFSAYVIVTVNTNKERKHRISKMDRLKMLAWTILQAEKFTTSLVYRNAVLTSLEVVRKDGSFIRDTKSICFVLGPELILSFVI